MKSYFAIGTKVRDPLIRFSEYSTGPYKPCQHCSTMFTHLGLRRHIEACADNPANKRKKKARR